MADLDRKLGRDYLKSEGFVEEGMEWHHPCGVIITEGPNGNWNARYRSIRNAHAVLSTYHTESRLREFQHSVQNWIARCNELATNDLQIAQSIANAVNARYGDGIARAYQSNRDAGVEFFGIDDFDLRVTGRKRVTLGSYGVYYAIVEFEDGSSDELEVGSESEKTNYDGERFLKFLQYLYSVGRDVYGVASDMKTIYVRDDLRAHVLLKLLESGLKEITKSTHVIRETCDDPVVAAVYAQGTRAINVFKIELKSELQP